MPKSRRLLETQTLGPKKAVLGGYCWFGIDVAMKAGAMALLNSLPSTLVTLIVCPQPVLIFERKDAQAALTRYNSFEKFTISSKPVTADYIHTGVFVPVFDTTESTERFTFSPLGNAATKLAYWDQEAWASELVVSTGSLKPVAGTTDVQVRTAADQAAAAAENEGLLKSDKEAEAKTKKRKAENSASDKLKKVI